MVVEGRRVDRWLSDGLEMCDEPREDAMQNTVLVEMTVYGELELMLYITN